MGKKTLGIAIPYWKNTEKCEIAFMKLIARINRQITDDMILYVYEDGQISYWLGDYTDANIIVDGETINYGVSYARNKCLDYLIDKVDYILFMDSDDSIDYDYLEKMLEECKKNEYEVIESGFWINENKIKFDAHILRNGVCGSAIQTKIIGDKRFDEHLQIAEDSNFMQDVVDLTIHRKTYVDTNYYYNLGVNPLSLTMRFGRKEISNIRC